MKSARWIKKQPQKEGKKASEKDINACGYMRVHIGTHAWKHTHTYIHMREVMVQNSISFENLATTFIDFGMRATWSPILAFTNSVTLGSFFGFLKPQFAQF